MSPAVISVPLWRGSEITWPVVSARTSTWRAASVRPFRRMPDCTGPAVKRSTTTDTGSLAGSAIGAASCVCCGSPLAIARSVSRSRITM